MEKTTEDAQPATARTTVIQDEAIGEAADS